jgi:Tol biopolymer transport system component
MQKSFNPNPVSPPADVAARAADRAPTAGRRAARVVAVLACLWVVMVSSAAADDTGRSELERTFLSPPVQVSMGMPKAGEGYFSADMRRICYQAVPEGYPFYQIFVQAFDAREPRPATPVRISTGRGRTTCSWFSPDGRRLLFASSHLDPQLDGTEAAARAQAEEDRRSGRRRRYQWDFDPHSEIYAVALEPDAAGERKLERLTQTPGYDAECSYSPDGSRILFVSDRDGDPDIYVMNADGSDVRQLTNAPGYDGGPFFSPDGKWIAYRTDRVEKDMLQIHVMRSDGSGDVALTSGQGVRWAPFWHPTKPWLIWTGADHTDPTARPNYDLWIARWKIEREARGDAVPEAGAGERFRAGPPLRITDHGGADVLPAFSPDGAWLMWTASRGGADGGPAPSQLWVSRPIDAAIEAALPPVAAEGPAATPAAAPAAQP